MPRIARVCAINYPHHVTQRGNNKGAVFFDDEDGEFYLESLSRGIGGTNLIYTQYINRKYKRSGRLWQNRFFSTIIDKGSYLWAVVRYIERNPVRAKLAKNAEDYPWSSAKAHTSGIKNNILSGELWLDEMKIVAYKEFLKHEDTEFESSIKKATSTGRPLGTEKFVNIMEEILNRQFSPRRAGQPKKE